MPFVFESVNNVELMQQQFVSRARQTNIHSDFGNLPDPLRPRGTFKYVSNSQQIIGSFPLTTARFSPHLAF